MLAAAIPDVVDAGAPYYGTPPAEEILNKVKAPLQLHFGGLDTRVNGTWPEYEKTLKANKVDYTASVYDNVNHGFHNDSTGRYSATEAELAWSRTIEFFKAQL
jgi:carboxymethylenebutenolidase